MRALKTGQNYQLKGIGRGSLKELKFTAEGKPVVVLDTFRGLFWLVINNSLAMHCFDWQTTAVVV